MDYLLGDILLKQLKLDEGCCNNPSKTSWCHKICHFRSYKFKVVLKTDFWHSPCLPFLGLCLWVILGALALWIVCITSHGHLFLYVCP